MTNINSHQRFSITKIAFPSVGLLLLICCAAIFALWYLPFDPQSPPPTKLGDEPEFDTLFRNEQWRYLFSENNKIIETDIYGKTERVVLGIAKATHNPNSELLYDFSISPDGKLLAANYFNERDLEDPWNPPLGKVLVVDLASGKVTDIPIVLESYDFQWERPAYWLNPNVFLISMRRFLGTNSSSEHEVFLRYDLRDLTNPQVIEIDNCGTTKVMNNATNVLLLASNCTPPSQMVVWALDVNGKRVANSQEKDFYEKCEEEWWLEDRCQRNLLTKSIASIKVESVTGDVMDGFGRWYDNNWYRDYIYLNEKLVRVTDAGVKGDLFWDSDIEMFIWAEENEMFQIDSKGHYRFWHNGQYLGKIPNNP